MTKKIRKPVEPYDTGPPERQQHHKVAIERDINNRPRLRVLDQLGIDRLLLARQITMDQHTAGEHLYRLITAAGYFPACRWVLDSGIRGDAQDISMQRSGALVRIGLARAWLHAKVGRQVTALLWGGILGERKILHSDVDFFRAGLSSFQAFEAWWHGRDHDQSIPALLAEMPRNVQTHRPRPFHHEV